MAKNSPKVQKTVAKTMRKYKVKSRKQAVSIGLSVARQKGYKAPKA